MRGLHLLAESVIVRAPPLERKAFSTRRHLAVDGGALALRCATLGRFLALSYDSMMHTKRLCNNDLVRSPKALRMFDQATTSKSFAVCKAERRLCY
jgi:hypothetical protein